MSSAPPFSATAPAPASTGLARHADIALAALVVSVIVMMALPLPPWVLDVLVATNISAGVMLLLMAMFVPTPLAFSTFPSVLLISTLFRISLNVATTRQILLQADAGEIIDAFGHMVVGGNLVVGLVVFLIITIVQFIVVAKGAERVAEVSARFTLDALPGKQMSIDADLRAGVISQSEAFQRRRDLVQESQFYGSMDGAMKFVKGDAIAGMVIVVVNLLGGIAIGALSLGMAVGDAVQRFSVLSIGDGLVSQVPALFVSIAAGIAITRTAPDSSANLGDQIGRQIGMQPRAMLLSAGVMALFALVPGFPTLTFLVLATATAATSTWLARRHRRAAHEQLRLELPAAGREGETLKVLLQHDLSGQRPPSPFRLELSATLVERLGTASLNAALDHERLLLRELYGIPFPGIVVRALDSLPDGALALLVQDLPDLAATLPESGVLALGPLPPTLVARWQEQGLVLDAAVPECLQPGVWRVEAGAAQAAEGDDALPSLELLPPARVVARLVMRTIQRHPGAALGVQEVRQLVREIESRFGDLTREALAILPLGRLADLMAALARERVPLNDFSGLLQALVTHGPGTQDLHSLYEAMRLALARAIVARLQPRAAAGGRPELPVVVLEAGTETALRAALVMRPDGPVLALPPAAVDALVVAVVQAFERSAAQGTQALLLPADLRRAASRLLRGVMPRAAFLSHEELAAAGARATPGASVLWPTAAG